MYSADGTLTLRAGKKMKAEIKKHYSLIAFCKLNGFDYNAFSQYLGGFRPCPGQKAKYNKAICKLIGFKNDAELTEWADK